MLTPACKRGWVALLVVTASACGSSATTAVTLNLSNTWTGTNSNSRGSGTITEHLTQTGNTITGTLTGSSTRDGVTVTYSGTVSGTLNGSNLTYSVTIPVGGFSAPDAACSLADSGSGTATDTSIHETYAGTSNCDGVLTAVTDGMVSLTAP